MSPFFSQFERKHLIAGSAALLVITLAIFLFGRQQKTFPPLPTGAFSGALDGLLEPGDKATFYVERLAGVNALLVVVLKEGWGPQLIELERAYEEVNVGEETLTQHVPLRPIVLQNGEREFTLYGEDIGGSFKGSFVTNDERKGKWSLKPSTRQIGDGSELSREYVSKWLEAEDVYLSLKREYSVLERLYEEDKDKHKQLQEFVSDEGVLREKAELRLTELREELATARKKRSDSLKQVSSLVSELDLLRRIKKRGKAVDLARRVASRENKWYLANWKAAEDVSSLEEFIPESSGIDLRELETEYRRAKEKQGMQLELAAERSRIKLLESRLETSREQDSVGEPEEAVGRKNRKRKNLWDRLWSNG